MRRNKNKGEEEPLEIYFRLFKMIPGEETQDEKDYRELLRAGIYIQKEYDYHDDKGNFFCALRWFDPRDADKKVEAKKKDDE
jgi:hypothetical protein